MAKSGPKGPRIVIDWPQFEKLCGLFCTLEEIAAFFNCSTDSIERNVKRHYRRDFADIWKQKSSLGKISIRRKIYDRGVNQGDSKTLIMLAKNHLGYLESPQPAPIEVHQNVRYVTEWGTPHSNSGEASHTLQSASDAAASPSVEVSVPGGIVGSPVGKVDVVPQ